VASLFPSSPDLSVALEQSLPPGCIAMTAPSAPQSRLSLNLAALLDARRIVLLLVGAAKWSTYQRARARGPITDMPVRALLQQQRVPVSVYWAP
jgi:6-phosphogluconolactonase